MEIKEPDAEVSFAPHDLRHSAFWAPRLATSIASSHALLILIGERIGGWQPPEYYAAPDRLITEPTYPLVPVMTAEAAQGLPFLGQIHCLRALNPSSEPAK